MTRSDDDPNAPTQHPGATEVRDTDVDDANVAATVRAKPEGTAATGLATSAREVSGLGLAAYRIGELLGRGGMGEVLLAHDAHIGRDVAIKRMREGEPAPPAIARFLREARIQARLDHPAIVPVYELGRDRRGRPYFSMKRLTGRTLGTVLESAAPPPRQRLLRAFADICLAVEFAHARGVVHRDLKPANIVLGDFGEVYILDWGVARIVAERDDASIGRDVDTFDGMTKAGAVVGTPGYMAPEQTRGDVVAAPADVYALGVILFEILAGEALHPRGQAALISTVSGIDGAPSRRRADRNVAPELDAICVAALVDEPSARPTAHELAERVQRYLDGDRDLERRRELAATQLAAARTALARGDSAARADVVRAAGRALALDPESDEAAELVTRLILEPPREPPPELGAELAASAQATQRRQARVAALSFGAIFAFLVVAACTGLDNWRLMAVLTAFTAVMAAVAIRFSRRAARPREMLFVALGNACLVALLSRTFGPLVVVPGVTCVMALSLTSYPQLIDRARIVIALLVASWLAPVALEYVGVLAPTWRIVDGEIHSMSRLISIGGAPTVGLLIFAHLATIVVIGMFASALATSRRNAQRELEIQAWHLRQLLPERRASAVNGAAGALTTDR